jgi:hypothetical protein
MAADLHERTAMLHEMFEALPRTARYGNTTISYGDVYYGPSGQFGALEELRSVCLYEYGCDDECVRALWGCWQLKLRTYVVGDLRASCEPWARRHPARRGYLALNAQTRGLFFHVDDCLAPTKYPALAGGIVRLVVELGEDKELAVAYEALGYRPPPSLTIERMPRADKSRKAIVATLGPYRGYVNMNRGQLRRLAAVYGCRLVDKTPWGRRQAKLREQLEMTRALPQPRTLRLRG